MNLTAQCVNFILGVLNQPPMDEVDHDWFYSDWAERAPRTTAERLADLLISRDPCPRDD
jgi:hypothetical protein